MHTAPFEFIIINCLGHTLTEISFTYEWCTEMPRNEGIQYSEFMQSPAVAASLTYETDSAHVNNSYSLIAFNW